MNGTVLNIIDGNGIIVDDNGERYNFIKSEVKQGILKNGSKVNFINTDGNASDIYLLESENIMSDAKETLSKSMSIGLDNLNNGSKAINEKINNYTGGSKVTSMGLLAALGVFFTILFSSISDILTILGFAMEMYALYNLAMIKEDMSFFIYKIKAIVSAIIAIYIIQSLAESIMYVIAGDSPVLAIIKIIILFAAIIYSIYSIFKSFTKIGKIFKVRLFIYAAWLFVFALISPVIFAFTKNIQLVLEAPYYLMLAHAIVLLVAYLKIKDNKEENIQ